MLKTIKNIILVTIFIGLPLCCKELHMKTIGLLGGTGWSSTIGYYSLLNELVGQNWVVIIAQKYY